MNILPHSPDAERSVLGSLLKDSNAYDKVAALLSDSDFYLPVNKIIYGAIVDVSNTKQPTDLTTVSTRLIQKKQLDSIGRVYLVELVEHVASTENVVTYANIVKDHSKLRQAIFIADKLSQEAYGKGDVTNLIDDASAELFALRSQNEVVQFKSMMGLLETVLTEIDLVVSNRVDELGIIRTGLDDLDREFLGYRESRFYIISAPSSAGKTEMLIAQTEHMATKQEKNVAIVSLEMQETEIAARILYANAPMDNKLVRPYGMKDSDHQKIAEASNRLVGVGIRIISPPTVNISNLRALIRNEKRENGMDIVFIDYAQLISGDKAKYGSREQEVAHVSRSLKALARELAIPVIALSQLNADGLQRESRALYHDADGVMKLNHDTKTKQSWIELDKNRHGHRVKVFLDYFFEAGGKWRQLDKIKREPDEREAMYG